jgi:hypothetical protein
MRHIFVTGPDGTGPLRVALICSQRAMLAGGAGTVDEHRRQAGNGRQAVRRAVLARRSAPCSGP